MANVYHNDLLAPFLALPQGDKVQAECELAVPPPIHSSFLTLILDVWVDGDGGLRSKTTVNSL
jgi:glutamine synthetase